MNKLISGLVLLFLLVGCSKGPTDEQLKTLLSEAHNQLMNKEQSFEVNDSLVAGMLKASEKDFDVMKIEARQLPLFDGQNTFKRSAALKNWIAPRLSQLAVQQDKDGAIASLFQIVLERGKDGYDFNAYQKLLQNPGMKELVKDDSVKNAAFVILLYVNCEPAQKAELVRAALPLITSEMSVKNAQQSMSVFDVALELGDAISAEELVAVREAVMAQYQRILPLIDETQKERVESGIIYLNSLFAQGKLIGSPAPEIDFAWISNGDAKKLSDFKGKVVVIDFWATWCGPCVKSFPNIRELQKRYKGYPVEIIGVTSLQGRHIDRSGEKPQTVDTKGNPELEYSLMKEFMKNMDMNWTVAFSTQAVFNPEYGVKGIPHVAIVDAEGNVRYNVLRPYDAPYHEAEKIDGLLKEAGLKYPAKPMVETNFAE